MKTKTEKYLLAAILLLLAFIWGHSMFPADVSASESKAVGGFIAPLLELFVGRGNVTDHLVRKLAHFTEFALLGALLRALNIAQDKNTLAEAEYTALKALAVCVADESIQLLVSGRAGQVQDILLDMCGVLFGMVIMSLFVVVIRALKKDI